MQTNQIEEFLKSLFVNSFTTIYEIYKKENLKNFNEMVQRFQQKLNAIITQEESDLLELYLEVNKSLKNEEKSISSFLKLKEMGVDNKKILIEMEETDLIECGLNKNMFPQKGLPQEFQDFLYKNLKHDKIEESIQKLIERGIVSQDKLFQINDDDSQSIYRFPKYQFKKWKQSISKTRPETASIPQQVPKNIQDLRKSNLSQFESISKKIKTKNNLTIFQYPIYKKNDLKDFEEYKTVILIGQTGSGKSTLINFFVNYHLVIEFEDDFRYFLIDEDNLNIDKTQAISQTQDVMIYYLRPANGNPGLRIIDTPGFGDTRGITQDKIIATKIHDCFKKQVDTLTTICFLVQSSNARLTINQNYILSSILQMFGNDVIENFVFMFTFCDGGAPQAEEALRFRGNEQNSGCPVAHLIEKIPTPWYLKFNSSAFLTLNTGENVDMDKLFWQIGMKSFKIFVEDKIKRYKDVSLMLTRDVIKQRETIMNVICHLRPKIQQQLCLIDQHKSTYQIINQLNAAMVDSQNFTVETTKFKFEKINLRSGEYVTNCVTCNYTCHFPCAIPDDKSKNGCAAMSNGKCTVCQNECHWNVHKNMSFRFESSQYKEKVELSELKQKYHQSQSTKTTKEQILDGIVKEYEQTSFECMEMQQNLMQAVNKLNQIALQPASRLQTLRRIC